MKALIVLLAAVVAAVARAGMPDVEINEALVVSVEKTPAGWVAVLSGEAALPIMAGENPDSGKLVTLYADRARVMVPIGNYFYGLTMRGQAAYEARLKAMVGKKTTVQMWGAVLTIESGRIVQIIAGDVTLLRPQKGEAAFDVSRLREIEAK